MEKITYEELGELLIKDLCNNAHIILNDSQITKKKTRETYVRTLDKIKNNKLKLEGKEEDQHEYIELYQALILGYEKRQVLEQTLQANIILLDSILERIQKREKTEEILANIPLPLTELQYNDIIKLVSQWKINQKESYEKLVFEASLYYSYKGQDTEIGQEIKKTRFNRNENAYKNDLKLFIKEHEKLYNMIRDDILKHDELKFLEKIEPVDYKKKTIKNRTLKSLDIYSYRDYLEWFSSDEIKEFLSKRKSQNYARHEFKGISILKSNTYTDEEIDERGYYIDHVQDLLKGLDGIEEMYCNKKNKEIIEHSIFNSIEPNVRGLKAWVSFIDLLIKNYKIKELESFKKGNYDFNIEIPLLNKEIEKTWFSFIGTGIQIDRKRAMFKTLFPKIELESFDTPQENIDMVQSEIMGFYPVTQLNLQEILDMLIGK